MNAARTRSMIAFSLGFAAAAVVIGVVAGQGTSSENGAGSEMRTGVTVTQSVAPNAPLVEKAVPSITS